LAILSTSVALTRYRVVEEADAALLRSVPERLVKHAFQDIDHTADERSFGWVNIDHMLDTRWRRSPPEKAAYLAFALRLETRRIAPAVLKKHLLMAMEAELERAKEGGKDFVGRERKKEVKEQVKLKLMARSLPVPALFEVVWNPAANRVWFGSTNAKARELFEDYFSETFELTLEPQTPFFLAMDILGEKAAQELEKLEPTVFV
jgi:hypothetical protein